MCHCCFFVIKMKFTCLNSFCAIEIKYRGLANEVPKVLQKIIVLTN